MIVNPVFKNSQLRDNIVASDSLSLLQEIPNSEKNYVVQTKTGLTAAGANFQATNLNQYSVGETEVVGTRQYVFSGYTVAPYSLSTGNPSEDNMGTGPFLWNPVQSSVDDFCLNKSISEIKFNVAGKQFTSTDRENPEMTDIFASQFDIEKLKSYGLYGPDGIRTTALQHNLNEVYGSELYSDEDIFAMGASAAGLYPVLKTAHTSTELMSTSAQWAKNSKGYVRYTVEYRAGSVTGPVLSQSSEIDGFVGIPVPLTGPGSGIIYYSYNGALPTGPFSFNTANKLFQIVTFEVHEFLIDPNLSNPYSKNQHKKIYFNGAYPLNLEFKFNQEYISNSFLQWKPSLRSSQVGSVVPANAVDPRIESATWVDMDIRFWTFNSASQIPQTSMKTLYYKEYRQTPDIITITKGATKEISVGRATINTAVQSSTPPIIIIYGACRKSQNSSYYDDNTNGRWVTNSPNVELFDIDSVNLQVGTQNDCLGNIELNRDQLVQHTLDVIGNPQYRQSLRSEISYLRYGDLGSVRTQAFGTPVTNDPQSVSTVSTTTAALLGARLQKNIGFNFYMIDMSRINLRSTSGVPMTPLVNFGASEYKAISVRPVFSLTKNMFDSMSGIVPVTSLKCEFNCVFMRPHLRVLPINSGSVQDEEVVYTLGNVSGQMMSKINEGYGNDGSSQLTYMGGSFLGNIWDKVSDFVSNPVVQGVAKAVLPVAMAALGENRSLEQRLKNKYQNA